MAKWNLFVISIGLLFIVLYPSEIGAVEHLVLGVILVAVGTVSLLRTSKNNKRK
ncbi:MAG: hypothetical protein GX038_01540 [Erysipelothrix sp.]|nr:hypothetical protein [Erysipelothrix sp.]